MQDRASEKMMAGARQPARTARGGFSLVWPLLAGVTAGAVVVAVVERLAGGTRFDGFLMLAAAGAAAVLAVRLLWKHPAATGQPAAPERDSFRFLLDSVADGICSADECGLVSFANPAAARLLGIPTASLAGEALHELLHGTGTPGCTCGKECRLRLALEHHVSSFGEDTVLRRDGVSFPAEYVLTPLLDQGRFSGSVISFRDISQRSALDRLKDEFISTVSHELRTPLTSIRGALGLLSSGILGQVNDKAANLLRIALTNSDRLVRLINDILDLERIQSGREPLTFRPVLLGDIVRQAFDGMQPVAEAAGVQLIHDSAKVEISADPDRLLQVLTNLLSNAVKFSPANSTISVTMQRGVSGVTLSVVDEGRGIPADKLEAIFGRFQQVDASDSRQKGGSGLGLAICRTIVLQHSGRIWAERNPVSRLDFPRFSPLSAGGGDYTRKSGQRAGPGHRLAGRRQWRHPALDRRTVGPPWLPGCGNRDRGTNRGGGPRWGGSHPAGHIAGRDERLGDSAPPAPVGPRSPHAGRSAERDERAKSGRVCPAWQRDGSTSRWKKISCWASWPGCFRFREKRPACWWWKTTSTWRV